MVIGILTEKPSAARNFAAALGGMTGTHQGQQYVITHARGHLYEFADPGAMVAPDLQEKYKKWDLDNLPWDPTAMSWDLKPIDGAGQTITDARRALGSCDEIVVACDVDPTGEGGMIAVNAVLEMGLAGKKFSRMYFTDEAPGSLAKAFVDRKPIASLSDFDEYKKARYRSQWDLLSMQFTRVATNMARESGQDMMLRQGRLKSAMVKLVGDQLKAHEDYVRKPFFANRFKDENGVTYTDPEEQRHDAAASVPRTWSVSPVTKDSSTDKSTAPPKLLDLASLAAMLVGKGVKAKDTLATYQSMYEAQVVSYPRTEDKTITPEQFNELSPLADQIAGVVGVDLGLLTHRSPRKTHVKPQGAHGANRPGPKVPASLDAIESKYGKTGRLIYQTLAKNYLAMLADDYRYTQHKGHVAKYPEYLGSANVPISMGWKSVFDPDAGDENAPGDEDENAKGLGTNAEPFVFEGANKRPEHPSMKWLMKQLEKRDVGTGATRTSTYSEVTNARAKYPLLIEKGRKVMLAEPGRLSWHLLPGTHIGDLALTEQVYADMKAIAAGQADGDELLLRVADMVAADIETMKANAVTMRSDLGLKHEAVSRTTKEKVSGTLASTGEEVAFARTWSGHRFSDDQIVALLAGETINIEATSTQGKTFTVHGRLAKQTYKGKTFFGFKKEGFGAIDANGVVLPPSLWCKHTFTDTEIAALLAGQSVEASDFVSQKGNSFACKVSFKEVKPGEGKKIVPDFDAGTDEPPAQWCKVKLSADQRADLAAGRKVAGKGFVSSKGKKFDATLTWVDEKGDGVKKIVPSFG